jgi:hypothetical protein
MTPVGVAVLMVKKMVKNLPVVLIRAVKVVLLI